MDHTERLAQEAMERCREHVRQCRGALDAIDGTRADEFFQTHYRAGTAGGKRLFSMTAAQVAGEFREWLSRESGN